MSENPSSWLDYLVSQGAVLSHGDVPEILTYKEGLLTASTQAASAAFTALNHLGIIVLEGEDASDFLHNQLTNDIHGLDATHASLAGYCSPKGRMLASMLVWKDGERLCIALPLEILPAIQKRLQMFVLRSKVKLSHIINTHVLLGLSQPDPLLLTQFFDSLPEQPYAMCQQEGHTLIRLPDAAKIPRYIWITPLQAATAVWEKLVLTLHPAPTAWWRWTEIQAGTPQILQATQEKFVPQMVNFERIGGVNFRKGCYPGQEIVARSQYLGKLKRRMLLAHLDKQDEAIVKSGDELFTESEPAQPSGMIVNAESAPDGSISCLIEIKLESLKDKLRWKSASGPLLHIDALPYPLPELE